MNCETCETSLLDLVYGELAADESEAVRAHVATCDGCARSLARLEGARALARAVPKETPPASITARVMEEARARAAATRAAAEAAQAKAAPTDAPTPREEPRSSFWQDLVRWIGSLAMGPQVAMAALLMLMVGMGLWYVPTLRLRPRDGATPVEPEPTTAESRSAALEPADPLRLGVDPHTGRITPVTEEEQRAAEIAQAREPEPRRVPRATAPEPQLAMADGLEAAEATAELAPGEGIGAVEEGPLPEVVAPELAGAREADTTERTIARAETSTARGSSSASTSGAGSAGSSLAGSGVAGESPLLELDSDREALVPTALHRQARHLAESGACAQAVPQYESLLTRHPTYADAPRAMVELGRCLRGLGRLSAARTWLERAQGFPSTSTLARHELARVTAMERAQERAVDSAAASEPDRAAARAEPAAVDAY